MNFIQYHYFTNITSRKETYRSRSTCTANRRSRNPDSFGQPTDTCSSTQSIPSRTFYSKRSRTKCNEHRTRLGKCTHPSAGSALSRNLCILRCFCCKSHIEWTLPYNFLPTNSSFQGIMYIFHRGL